MSRKPRTAGEYLHIIVRGIGKQILFEEKYDNEKYLAYLKRFASETGITVLAYCLMENHVHLLLRDDRSEIAVFMKKTGVGYAQYYNKKYERTGHLFQDRYKSENITGEAQLLSIYRYILNNPFKAGICRAEDYPWSSYHEYGRTNGLTNTEMLCELIGDENAFRSFMRKSDDVEHMEAEARKKDDAWALTTLQNALNIVSGTQLQQFDKAQRDEAIVLLKEKGLSVRQIERLTGINRGVVQKARKVVKENRPC